MTTQTEEHVAPRLSTGRKPVGNSGKDNDMGMKVLNDSLLIILGCWVLLGLIWYSLRDSNI